MDAQSTVAVYRVGPDGSTGEYLGPALLIHPGMAVPATALTAALSEPDQALRVAIATPSPAGPVAEVIDVRAVHRLRPELGRDRDSALVGLELAGRASAAGDVAESSVRATPQEALRLVGEQLEQTASLPPHPLPNVHGLPCVLFGLWCQPRPGAEADR